MKKYQIIYADPPYDMKDISIDRDHSIHDSYERVKHLEIKGNIK